MKQISLMMIMFCIWAYVKVIVPVICLLGPLLLSIFVSPWWIFAYFVTTPALISTTAVMCLKDD